MMAFARRPSSPEPAELSPLYSATCSMYPNPATPVLLLVAAPMMPETCTVTEVVLPGTGSGADGGGNKGLALGERELAAGSRVCGGATCIHEVGMGAVRAGVDYDDGEARRIGCAGGQVWIR